MSGTGNGVTVLAGGGRSGPVNGAHNGLRLCPSCGRSIGWDAGACPYCMWSWTAPGAADVSGTISRGKRALLYLASFLIPLFGVIIGVIYMSKSDQAYRSVGTLCLVLGVASLVILPTVLAAVLYLMVLGM